MADSIVFYCRFSFSNVDWGYRKMMLLSETVSGNVVVESTTEEIVTDDVSGNVTDVIEPQEGETNNVDVSGNDVVVPGNVAGDITNDNESIETNTELLEKLDNIETVLTSIDYSCTALVFVLVAVYVLDKIERGVRRFKNNE